MKKFTGYAIAASAAMAIMAGCSDWTKPERVTTQHPDEQSEIVRDDAYYTALRAYKQTAHKIAFGWYGSWTANGASYQSRLVSAPDSMDIISIWSQWHSLTPEQIADKEYVQKVKGTKVTFTIFAHEVPEEFLVNGTVTREGLAAYAKSYADSTEKYNYDGIDLDYEPGYGATGPLVGHDDPEMSMFVEELAKYFGPKSGTGKLLLIDGVPYAVESRLAEYFDYGIVQAYNSSGYTDLQNRFNNAYNKGWKPEQYIFAENFESYWKNGGVTHTTRDGQSVNSLLGMARFNPEQGFCGGFGAYHMEYEYGNTEKPYKYMREAIQDVNPAGGSLTVSLAGSAAETMYIIVNDDGSLKGEAKTDLSVNFARPLSEDISFEVEVDNSLVEDYNLENGTEYLSLDPSLVQVGNVTAKAGTIASDKAGVEADISGVDNGKYLIPVKVILPENSIYSAKEDIVKYIIVYKATLDIDTEATSLTGNKIEPSGNWTITCYQGSNSSGANGVWNLDSDEQKARMFDGKLDGNGWYGNNASYSWGNGGNFIIGLDRIYEINGFRWHVWTTDSNPQVTDFQYSKDGAKWESLLNGETFVPAITDGWKIFRFKKTVKARYLRVFVGPISSGYTSMDEAEIYAPEN